MRRIRFRRSAKREMFELDDETFLRVARAVLDFQEEPRPRGYDTVAGREDQCRIWVGRDHRLLYESDARADRIIIVGSGGRTNPPPRKETGFMTQPGSVG